MFARVQVVAPQTTGREYNPEAIFSSDRSSSSSSPPPPPPSTVDAEQLETGPELQCAGPWTFFTVIGLRIFLGLSEVPPASCFPLP